MKINVISLNRQHLLDLSIGLYENGCDVKFYTAVPKSRCCKFGAASKMVVSMFIHLIPSAIWYKLHRTTNNFLPIDQKFINLVLKKMRPCDVVILNGYSFSCNSSVYRFIQDKLGANVVMEMGSKHTFEENKAFDNLKSYPKEFLEKDLECYEVADIISIPAKHVMESFLMHNVPQEKLFVNPYGVNTRIFNNTILCEEPYDLIMVGSWSKRKGADYTTELCRKYGYKFLHVGSIVDIPFPSDVSNMRHIDSVNEYELPRYYAQAKVFILPSRTEGLALVQAQAMACGLPLVCSCNTGGKDLGDLLNVTNESVFVFTEYDIEVINDCVKKALHFADTQKNPRSLATNAQKILSWVRYGKTYKEFLISRFGKRCQ